MTKVAWIRHLAGLFAFSCLEIAIFTTAQASEARKWIVAD